MASYLRRLILFAGLCLLAAPLSASAGGASDGITGSLLDLLKHSGPAPAALISFSLGLALAFTPCVYPMIPITVAFFAGQSAGRKSKAFRLALAYVVGIAVTYSALGVAVSSFGLMMGSVLQNTWALVLIAAVFTGLALSMFGLFEIRPPAFIMNRSAARSGVAGALLMGLMVGVVASPCIGPIVGGVAVWVAQAKNPVLGFWVFFSLSLGMGIPFLALAVFSGALARLPRAGPWMVTVKNLSGLALLGAAVYFARLLLPGQSQSAALPVFLIAAALYLLLFDGSLKAVRAGKLLRPVLSVPLVLVGVWFLVPHPQPSVSWRPYSSQALQQAVRSAKNVMLDFTAEWCGGCKEMEDVTFSDPKVIGQTRPYVRLRVDLTSKSKEGSAAIERFNVKGIPTVIFLDGYGREIPRSRIVGFVPPDEFLARINAAYLPRLSK